MCDNCIQRMKDMNPALLAKLEEISVPLMALADQVMPLLPAEFTTLSLVNIDTGGIQQPSQDKVDAMMEWQPSYARNLALTYMAAFMAFRFTKGMDQMVAQQVVAVSILNEGANDGHAAHYVANGEKH